MNVNQLLKSKIIDISGCNNWNEILDLCYTVFSNEIRRLPNLFGRKVIINGLNKKTKDGISEAFLHMISFAKSHNFKILPCINDYDYQDICDKNCLNCHYQVTLTFGSEKERNLCIYRAIRIRWVVELIKLANSNNQNIQMWVKNEKMHLRYKNNSIDYIAIFVEAKIKGKKVYKLISNFPVIYTSNSYKYDREYKKYIENNKKTDLHL